MKANELRIGNYIRSNNKEYLPHICGSTGIITKIGLRQDKMYPDSNAVVTFGIGYTEYDQFIELIEAIPLTEEWLLRFGFDVGICKEQFLINIRPSVLMSVFINIKGYNCFVGDELELDVKYVHQLQNLYFAVTGEELTLKE